MLGDRDYMREDDGGAGGGLGDPRSWTAVKVLLFLNLGVFVLQHFVFRNGAPFWHPDGNPAGGVSAQGLMDGEIWGLFTYMFVHSGFQAGGLAFLHILGNMLILFFIGRHVERMVGRVWFYVLFVGGGLAGALLELVISRNTYIIGASGATMAVLLAFATSEPERRIMMLIPLPVEVKLRTLGRLVLGISLVLGVIAKLAGPSAGGMGNMVLNVAHFTHLGGALFGMLLMSKIRPASAGSFGMSRGDILRGV
ncbi:MAG: rhomboid family intramembrane serine protease, partial [Verrucomicrobiales bacterium]|nr:rhomboid family intramembrane serine protease [Verrucomicrobiales bacterium]